jgi:predicted DNA repair protein MutK
MAALLDDVAAQTKIAAQKTAGVLGDDLALNAEQVSGVRAERELPVVWAVFKGSMLNKAILVPAALLISAVAPSLIIVMLMIGGAYLCYEGVEKILHVYLESKEKIDEHRAELTNALLDPEADLVALEKEKIKGAIRTDFILSAEIIVITLGTVAASTLPTRIAVLVTIALAMTLGVYGLVAGIVKIDDAGLHLSKKDSVILKYIGRGLLAAAPLLMKALSFFGTVAMFLVGGGILTHGFHQLSHAIEGLAHSAATLPGIGSVLAAITPMLANATVGIIAGSILVAVIHYIQKLRGKSAH